MAGLSEATVIRYPVVTQSHGFPSLLSGHKLRYMPTQGRLVRHIEIQ